MTASSAVRAFAIGLVAATATSIVEAPAATVDGAADADRSGVAIERAASRSGDLRLRLLFATDVPTTEPTALAELVESARGSTDPLVLQLLLSRCRQRATHDAGPCDAVDVATRWTRADAENAMAWVELATLLDESGDRAGADAAIERAGRASTFRDPTDAFAGIVLAAAPRTTDARRRYDDLVVALGVAAAVPVPWYRDVRDACKAGARAAACARMADVAFRDADTFAALMTARQLTAQAGEPAWLHDERQRREEALRWAASAASRDVGLESVDAPPPGRLAAAVALLEARIRRGEVAVAGDALQARRVSDADGAHRYRDDMAALMARLKPAN